jgi:NADH:ubiquinone oxidoreductase subunit
MSLGTTLYTWFYGKLVAEDSFKNKYYCNSENFSNLEAKRWVIFHKDIESTKVPPHWHAWLHKTIDVPPLNYSHKYKWQKDHEQNMTGTEKAYFPDTHPLSNSYKIQEIKKNKSEYESWTP